MGTVSADDIQFIDDVYSSNAIYLAWTVPTNTGQPLTQIVEYTKCGNDNWKSVGEIHDASQRYRNNLPNATIYSLTLNDLKPDTIYKIRYLGTIYQVRTLSDKDDWKFYAKKAAPYAVGAVGAVILAPAALGLLGFETGLK